MSHKKYLEINPEDLAKVQATRLRHEESKVEIDREWYFVAAFGKHFGWGGIRAILDNEIDLDTANVLMSAASKIDMGHMYDDARSSFIAFGAVNSKKPSKNFNSLTKDIRKQMAI